MADAKVFNIKGTGYTIIDQTARDAAQRAASQAELNRQLAIGKYPGQSLATLLAGEIASGKTVYDALHARAQAGNFAGLRVGDYLDVPLVSASAVTPAQSARFLIAHFDPYYQCGDAPKGHHIAFASSAPVAVASGVAGAQNDSYLQWNTAASNNGTAEEKHPYLASNLKAWEKLFAACLPEGLSRYLLVQRVLLAERFSDAGALTEDSSWSWADLGKVWSFSEVEVYGQNVWSKPGYSTGFDCQLDLFRDAAHRINGSRVTWWLRSPAAGSSSDVCCVNANGYANHSAATHGWVRPRPGFLLG